MKSNELMIGDWVKFMDEPLKVQHIYNNGYDDIVAETMEEFLDEDGFICEEIKDVTLVNCSPIPLTSEILEKNGWIQCKYETCKSLYEYKCLHLRHTMIKRSNGRWVANVGGIVEKFTDEYTHSFLRINVFYVHELQHALRLCGLNELADNFKI